MLTLAYVLCERVELANCSGDRIRHFHIVKDRLRNQLLWWKATMKRVSVRANNCALCHDGIITSILQHKELLMWRSFAPVASIHKVKVSLMWFAFLVFLRMTERKDIWQSRYYAIPKLYMTLAGLWPYHPIRDRYLHFVPTFTICSIILIPMVHN